MNDTIYEKCKSFLKKYPKTIAFRVKRHASVVQEHLNDDEVVLFAFLGQKNSNILLPFYTTIVVFTHKRMILCSKRFFGRYYYSSITPDMLNDFEIRANFIFGLVEIDTVKEHFTMNCLDKRALPKIEDALSKYFVDEKLEYLKELKNSKTNKIENENK